MKFCQLILCIVNVLLKLPKFSFFLFYLNSAEVSIVTVNLFFIDFIHTRDFETKGSMI